jgi:hypothetical protein
LNGHKFGTASQETQQFAADSVPFDGLMGLAQSVGPVVRYSMFDISTPVSQTLSQQQTLTPVEAAAQSNLIPHAITSYKLSRGTGNDNDGQVTFGGLDYTKFDSSTLVTMENASKGGFWEANLDAVSIDGQDAGLKGRTAVLDTGL